MQCSHDGCLYYNCHEALCKLKPDTVYRKINWERDWEKWTDLNLKFNFIDKDHLRKKFQSVRLYFVMKIQLNLNKTASLIPKKQGQNNNEWQRLASQHGGVLFPRWRILSHASLHFYGVCDKKCFNQKGDSAHLNVFLFYYTMSQMYVLFEPSIHYMTKACQCFTVCFKAEHQNLSLIKSHTYTVVCFYRPGCCVFLFCMQRCASLLCGVQGPVSVTRLRDSEPWRLFTR